MPFTILVQVSAFYMFPIVFITRATVSQHTNLLYQMSIHWLKFKIAAWSRKILDKHSTFCLYFIKKSDQTYTDTHSKRRKAHARLCMADLLFFCVCFYLFVCYVFFLFCSTRLSFLLVPGYNKQLSKNRAI